MVDPVGALLEPATWLLLLIVAITGTSLYLSHLRTGRSRVAVRLADGAPAPAFATGTSGRWSADVTFAVTNTGESGAVVLDRERELRGLRGDDGVQLPEGLTLTRGTSERFTAGLELAPRSVKRVEEQLRLEGPDDVLVEYEAAVVRLSLEVEDAAGAYTASVEFDVDLLGPRMLHRTSG